MQQADRLILNVLSNYLLTLVAGVAGLLVVPVALAELGSDGFGLASLLLAAFLMVQTLADGAGRSLQRYMPRDLSGPDPAHVSTTFSSGMAWFAILGALGALGLWAARGVYLDPPGLTQLQREEAFETLLLVLGSLLLLFFLKAYRAGLEALQRYDLISPRFGLLTAVRAAALIAIFGLGHGSIPIFVGSYLLATLLGDLWFRRALRRELPLLRPSLRSIGAPELRTLAGFSAGAMLIAIGNMLGTEGFRILVSRSLGMSEVGMFSALLAFRTMASTLIENVSNVLTPAVSTLDAHGATSRFAPLLVGATKYASVASALVCVVPLAVAGSFLGLWLGEEARSYAPVMYAILVGQILVLVSASAQQVLVGLGQARRAGSTVMLRGIASLLAALAYVSLAARPTLLGATLWLYAVQSLGAIAMLAFGASATGAAFPALLRAALLRPLGLALLGAGATAISAHWLGSSTWWSLGVCVGIGEATFILLVAAFGIDGDERRRILDFAGRAWNWARS